MAPITDDSIAPKEIIVPASRGLSTPKSGTIVVSGAYLAFYNGTKWHYLSGAHNSPN